MLNQELYLLCKRYHAVLLEDTDDSLIIAVSLAPTDTFLRALRFIRKGKIAFEYWPNAKIEQALNLLLPSTQESALATTTPLENLLDSKEALSSISFIDEVLQTAITKRASDVHFEPYQAHYRIRIRIDGVLQEMCSFPLTTWHEQLHTRLKVMADLNVAERRLPQDGQLHLIRDNVYYAMRIATLPVQYGEKIAIRILYHQQELSLEQLGFYQEDLDLFSAALANPQGLILVTGPTGSGKSITLYSSLNVLNQRGKNIYSVEDPIELSLAGVNQIQVNHKISLNFTKILRALLRQDPDVIMIGEIRDQETAEIAVSAAQTGHLVLSTLHTNSTVETLARLIQMGIPSYLLASCLKLVVAQRLVRRLCTYCKIPSTTPLNLPKTLWQKPLIHWQGRGCIHCHTGYYGRIAIYELLPITTQIKTTLDVNTNNSSLAELFRQQSEKSLLKAGLHLVEQGITALEEIQRVTCWEIPNL